MLTGSGISDIRAKMAKSINDSVDRVIGAHIKPVNTNSGVNVNTEVTPTTVNKDAVNTDRHSKGYMKTYMAKRRSKTKVPKSCPYCKHELP